MYEEHDGVALLSARERQVALAVSLGLSNKQIASSLDLSLRSIELLRHNACQRLGIPASHLVIWAVEHRESLK